MRRRLAITAVVFACLGLLGVVGFRSWLASTQHAAHWEGAIRAFEADDREHPPDPGRILFVGSSSIRMWTTLEDDMAPLRVLNRGFGGSHIDHVTHYARRIVVPYAPSAIVLYAGDNDVAFGKDAARVERDFRRFVALVRGELGAVPVVWLDIKPSLARWQHWPEMARANARIEALAAADPALEVIDVATPMLGPDGTPRGDLLIMDGLHMNADGYALWTSLVRPRLLALSGTQPRDGAGHGD